jgi:hypothetical protein
MALRQYNVRIDEDLIARIEHDRKALGLSQSRYVEHLAETHLAAADTDLPEPTDTQLAEAAELAARIRGH